MAEKIQCKTCGYMLDPDAQFCPMCFAPTNVGPQPAPQPQPTPGPQPGLDRGYNYGPGPQPAQGGNGKIIGLIIGLAAEVLITVGVDILYFFATLVYVTVSLRSSMICRITLFVIRAYFPSRFILS